MKGEDFIVIFLTSDVSHFQSAVVSPPYSPVSLPYDAAAVKRASSVVNFS